MKQLYERLHFVQAFFIFENSNFNKMKYLLPVFLYSIAFITSFAEEKNKVSTVYQNAVDSINSREDVIKFIERYIPDYNEPLNFYDSACVGRHEYYKVDFDKDGHTDLIENGRSFMLFIDTGNNQFERMYINGCTSLMRDRIKLINLITDAEQPLLQVQKTLKRNEGEGYNEFTDTLIFANGKLIEYNNTPQNHIIDCINLETGPCFGECPVYNMSILKDGSIVFKAEYYNKRNGLYITTLKKQALDSLHTFLNYIDFSNLQDEYFIWATDLPAADLVIHYDGGKVKHIYDYGMVGTLGLKHLYELISSWDVSKKWKKISTAPDIPCIKKQ